MEGMEGDAGSTTLCPTKNVKADEKLEKLRLMDVLTQDSVGETNEKLQEPQVDSQIPTSLTSQCTKEEVEDPTEDIVEENSFRMSMWEKLIKATNELGDEVKSEESIQVPAIDLLLRIQAALDE